MLVCHFEYCVIKRAYDAFLGGNGVFSPRQRKKNKKMLKKKIKVGHTYIITRV